MTFIPRLYRLAFAFALTLPLTPAFAQVCNQAATYDCVVAKGSLLNQTGYFGTHTLYTSPGGGDFVLYLNLEQVVVSVSNPQVTTGGELGYAWTDTHGAHTAGYWGMPAWTVAGNESLPLSPVYIRLAPGATLSLTETALPNQSGGTSGSAPYGDYYDVYWIVKQIGAVGTY